jgi:MFS family permease
MSRTRSVTPLRVMISRGYGPFFIGNLLSNSGTWFQTIALVLLIYRLTESTFLVGVVNFAQFAGIIFLAPVAGSAADRFDRKRLLIVTQSGAVLLSGALALVTAADMASPPIVITIALAIGATTAFATPAMQALVPALVTRNELPAAVALTAVTFNLSRAVGPVLGVLVVSAWGLPAAFAINSLSYVIFIVLLLTLRPRPFERPIGPPPRLMDSFRMVRADVALTSLVLAVGIASLTADPVNTLTPAFSTQIFDRPDTFTGFLVGAFGCGAVSAAFIIPRWSPSFRILTVTLLFMFVGTLGFALSTTAAVGVGTLFVTGFGYLGTVTVSTSILQLSLDDAHRGRVMALWSLSFHGVRPIGSLIDGFIASFALRAAAIVMSLPALAGAMRMAWLDRKGVAAPEPAS